MNEIKVMGGRPEKNEFIFSRPLKGELAEEVFESTRKYVGDNFSEALFFKKYFEFDRENERINCSDHFWSLATDIQLRKKGLWIPDPAGARAPRFPIFSRAIDVGFVLYSDNGDDCDLARPLLKNNERDLPLVLSFRALDLEREDNSYGVRLKIRDDCDLKEGEHVISGKEAQDGVLYNFYNDITGIKALYKRLDPYDHYLSIQKGIYDSYNIGLSGIDVVFESGTKEHILCLKEKELTNELNNERADIKEDIKRLELRLSTGLDLEKERKLKSFESDFVINQRKGKEINPAALLGGLL